MSTFPSIVHGDGCGYRGFSIDDCRLRTFILPFALHPSRHHFVALSRRVKEVSAEANSRHATIYLSLTRVALNFDEARLHYSFKRLPDDNNNWFHAETPIVPFHFCILPISRTRIVLIAFPLESSS